jgi:hypothetical protein
VSFAFAFLTLLINLDAEARQVIGHCEAGAHTFRAVALRLIDDGFLHQPTIPFISTNIALTSDSRSGFSFGD